MLTDYVSLPVFIASFAIGLIFVYVLGPETQNIYVYPTPQTYMNYQYKDGAGQCFEFKPVVTECPMNSFSVKTVPIQK
jgi:hypothetical protein